MRGVVVRLAAIKKWRRSDLGVMRGRANSHMRPAQVATTASEQRRTSLIRRLGVGLHCLHHVQICGKRGGRWGPGASPSFVRLWPAAAANSSRRIDLEMTTIRMAGAGKLIRAVCQALLTLRNRAVESSAADGQILQPRQAKSVCGGLQLCARTVMNRSPVASRQPV